MNYNEAKRTALRQFHESYLAKALEESQGNPTLAASKCGFSVQTFYRLIVSTFGSIKALQPVKPIRLSPHQLAALRVLKLEPTTTCKLGTLRSLKAIGFIDESNKLTDSGSKFLETQV